MARTGYTLPVFAVAAAKAAWLHLVESDSTTRKEAIALDLMPEAATIPLEQVARLDDQTALAVTRSDPGDNLDLTRDTPIWAWVQRHPRGAEALHLEAGEGIGITTTGMLSISRYARQLFDHNLLPLIPPDVTLVVRIILPEGRALAERTSNAAFGILEGLSLLGTSGFSHPLSAADYLEEFQTQLGDRLQTTSHLVFCIGQHGLHVATRLGISNDRIVQTGNWIGALLVEAGLRGAASVLLLGYHGKLVKLAGGIFNTSSHLADAKLEILAAMAIQTGASLEIAQTILTSPTADTAQKKLAEQELSTPVFTTLAERIRERSHAYVQKYANVSLTIGTILFDRAGHILAQDAIAPTLIPQP
jgi:cobalt-precorrin-5B (C1)-methyltransferase